MSKNPIVTAVAVQAMDRDLLDNHPNLFVKQTRKGWLMELCLGCDANTEFKIATMENMNQNIMYATEDTSCCIRMFCGALRPFTITVSEGGEKGGKVHSHHERPFACPLANCKCCCFQEIEVKTATGAPIGKVLEDQWFCVPSFKILDANQTLQYNVHQPTCCGGCCVDICAEGCCSCRIPFHIYEPGKHTKGEEVGQVVKIWSGLGKEMFTDADNFELRFPPNADAHTKTRLLGATFLINQLFFEGQGSSNGGNGPQ
eukprot:CAMPEP_0184980898 /NCGR_PEP_ID=MMETSP1098-20130426/10767_1 /TAXON_ID=89044 /ORGANISM="Spumella elongata, Strain CCAP 955/1" /LENGTH=257 /DNA_ID=CAMNT_0027504399 /DNA_START=32 /DNA_END=805 /DNA_ORIENTATION=+